jgi:hypothetical protein
MNDVRHRVKSSNQTSIDLIKLLFISLYDNDHLLKNKCLETRHVVINNFKMISINADKNQNTKKRHRYVYLIISPRVLTFLVVKKTEIKVREKKKRNDFSLQSSSRWTLSYINIER